MSGTILRGSPEHKAHLHGVEVDKVLKTLKPSPVLVKKEGSTEDPDKGPTVEEFIASGYNPKNYPPTGFNSKSTLVDIAKAIVTYDARPKVDAKVQKINQLKFDLSKATKPEEIEKFKAEIAALESKTE